MEHVTIAKFATGMRAASLVEDLQKAGISATKIQAKWTNKRLPPPRIEVQVAASDVEAAQAVVKQFNGEGR